MSPVEDRRRGDGRRALLLTHSYWPEHTPPQRRWQRLVAGLRAEGWSVDVVTPAADARSTPVAERGSGAAGVRSVSGPAGEQVHRVLRPLLRDSRAGRFSADAVAAGLMVPRALLVERPDVVVATVPALPVICSGWLAARLRRVPLVVDMRDAWPELAREAGVRAGPAGRMMETVVAAVQRRAELVVTVTHGFARRLAARGVERVTTISNGVALDEVPQLEHRERAAGELRVAYLGNHGESQALDAVIDAAAALHAAGEVAVRLRMVGSGTQKPRLVARAADCPAIEFHDPVHGEELWQHHRWADTVLISLRTDWESFAWTVPSKTFELMGTGKHITAAVVGEAAEILAAAENVTLVDQGPDGLAEALVALARDPESTPISDSGRRWVREHADLPRLAEDYAGLLADVVDRRGPVGSAPRDREQALDPRATADPGPVRADRVWVCVCTYRRNELLAELLTSLRAAAPQELGEDVLPPLVVVDNDPAAGAAETVAELAPEAIAVHQPRPGLAVARNAALDAVPDDADAVVFVDDDERVAPGWLDALISTARSSGAATVSGPVESIFPPEASAQAVEDGAIRRTDFATGPWSLRPATNNVLVRAEWFTRSPAFRFDEAFNVTGGEDSELFGRLQAAGATSWWCAAARVSEEVPLERTTRQWLRRRGLRNGHVRALKARKAQRSSASIAAEGAARFGAGVLRRGAVRVRGRRAGYQDRLWTREGMGMLQWLAGRARGEYARN